MCVRVNAGAWCLLPSCCFMLPILTQRRTIHVYFVIEDHYLSYARMETDSASIWHKASTLMSTFCHRHNQWSGVHERLTHKHTNTVSRSRSLTMCHKNWLFIKFYGCLLFDRWRIWLKCCIDARRLRAETKMCAIFFAIDRFPINIMLSFKRIMSSVWHCSHSLLSLLRLMVGV